MNNTLSIVTKFETMLQDLTEHSIRLERDNMLLRKGFATMASNICLNEDGNTTLELTEKEVEFLKQVVNTCNVFNTRG